MAYWYTRHNMQHKAHFSEARQVNWLRNMAYRYVTVYTLTCYTVHKALFTMTRHKKAYRGTQSRLHRGHTGYATWLIMH